MTLKTTLARLGRIVAGVALGVGVTGSLLAPAPAHAQPAPPAAAAPAPAPTTVARPALWVVRDADTTIYLLGTVHALRPTVQWRNAQIDQALAASQALWLEIEDVDDPAAMQPLVQQLGVDQTRTLSSRLNDEDRALLAQTSAALGMPAQALEPMRPWLAGMTLTVAPLIRAGYDPTRGVDRLIKEAAVARGLPVHGFETVEQQMRFFADLPEDQQIAFLHQALEDYAEGPAVIDRLADAWARGDVPTIETIMVREMRDRSPSLYQLLLVQRNQAFAARIREMLAEHGNTVFIAVGAGHLAGADSVQAQLARLGVRAERAP